MGNGGSVGKDIFLAEFSVKYYWDTFWESLYQFIIRQLEISGCD